MYKAIRISILLLFFMALPCAAQRSDSLLAHADSLYDLYDYEQSARFYRLAANLDSSRFEPFWKLGRSLNLLGETAPKDSQLVIYEEAGDSEKHALSLDEGHADAHFQLARALGKIALFKGIFKSASLAKQVRDECLRALEIDSLHDGAWHILGRWHREVGKKARILRIPMGLGEANKEDALAFMKKAVDIKPDYINHRLEMGITFLRFGDRDSARSEFNECLRLPSQRPLDEKYKEEAKKYLAEMDRK